MSTACGSSNHRVHRSLSGTCFSFVANCRRKLWWPRPGSGPSRAPMYLSLIPPARSSMYWSELYPGSGCARQPEAPEGYPARWVGTRTPSTSAPQGRAQAGRLRTPRSPLAPPPEHRPSRCNRTKHSLLLVAGGLVPNSERHHPQKSWGPRTRNYSRPPRIRASITVLQFPFPRSSPP
jgi:hypothetical protein